MGRVHVLSAEISENRITTLSVKMHGLPERTIDRDTAIAWLRDGHSLVPVGTSEPAPALQLVEVPVDGEGAYFVRTDNAAEAADALPALTDATAS